MTGVAPHQKANVMFEPHGPGYRMWCDPVFSRLVFALEGVTRVKRCQTTGGPCWEVTLDPRYDRAEIELAVYEMAKQAAANVGIGRWLQ